MNFKNNPEILRKFHSDMYLNHTFDHGPVDRSPISLAPYYYTDKVTPWIADSSSECRPLNYLKDYLKLFSVSRLTTSIYCYIFFLPTSFYSMLA